MVSQSHNPYFSRWFSAIDGLIDVLNQQKAVTILILVDGFLQFKKYDLLDTKDLSQSLF